MHESDAKRIAAATLAAGIVQVRGAKTVAEIKEAFKDAGYIAAPPSSSGADKFRYDEYQEWKKKHGVE